ncbi:MAG: NUDIX hydrolase [Euryarchaeota archaeon]|nr:NUDIX hydrolase [Euryarchaeota archaeon]MBT4981847.1 NUDIX hydrolase [Euryarchaeota archaeon]MBT5185010.1 NUDIX hydrolase [Euryarchaeota archaeon]
MYFGHHFLKKNCSKRFRHIKHASVGLVSDLAACDDCGQWPQPSLAVDAIAIRGDEVLLIRRKNEPWKGMLAFPGGFVESDEDPEVAVIRELKEECGIDGKVVRLLCVKGDPKRDPRGHIVSIAYLVAAFEEPIAGDDAASAAWYRISEVESLAGDHMSMLDKIKHF